MRLAGALAAILAISAPGLAAPPPKGRVLIRRGELVRVLVKLGRVRVHSVARSLSMGRRGDFIRLKNPRTRREFSGRVLDAGRVIVELKHQW